MDLYFGQIDTQTNSHTQRQTNGNIDIHTYRQIDSMGEACFTSDIILSLPAALGTTSSFNNFFQNSKEQRGFVTKSYWGWRLVLLDYRIVEQRGDNDNLGWWVVITLPIDRDIVCCTSSSHSISPIIAPWKYSSLAQIPLCVPPPS